MGISLTNITGSAQTGLTTPGYTVSADTAPSPNGKQWAITALTGTQTGVDAHSVGNPFTVTFVRPSTYKQLGVPNPNTGRLSSVPRNTHKVITRKGITPLAGEPKVVMNIITTIDVPAGADLVDPQSVRAALSAHIGSLSQQSSNYGDLCVTGVI